MQELYYVKVKQWCRLNYQVSNLESNSMAHAINTIYCILLLKILLQFPSHFNKVQSSQGYNKVSISCTVSGIQVFNNCILLSQLNNCCHSQGIVGQIFTKCFVNWNLSKSFTEHTQIKVMCQREWQLYASSFLCFLAIYLYQSICLSAMVYIINV